MENSIFIAKMFSVFYVVVGFGMLVNYSSFKKMVTEMMKSASLLYFGGIMALVAGFLIVNSHNLWVKDWTVIITVLGWAALLKGIFLIVFPKALAFLTKSLMKVLWLVVVVAFVLGGVLGYYGFFA
ncbi:MAG: hypothetical protein Q8P62_00735 [Candidatus Peregrinibacteria bacterium]|nr:hypothetical protein [Candidatus Peregrinibacteria bacterium]